MSHKTNHTQKFPHEVYRDNPFAHESHFSERSPIRVEIPSFEQAKPDLPAPHWSNNPLAIEAYWRAWEIGFSNIRNPQEDSGFITPFVDNAFNDCFFMWDSAFITFFTRYGRRAFDFQQSLNNLYAKQHPDGFICREIHTLTGEDQFHRLDNPSTGPNILAWAEWQYYQDTGDEERLRGVFPALIAYHQWLRQYRTWRDGSYWSTGWGSGMDNQPRVSGSWSATVHSHNHQVWVDANLQMILSAKILYQMAGVLGRRMDVPDMSGEAAYLKRYVNKLMWEDYSAFYYDLGRDGNRLSFLKTIGAYWALLADVVDHAEHLGRFVEHLTHPDRFNRLHRVPSLSAEHSEYRSDGDYWRGGVWSPTNYMVLRGLTNTHYDKLAHEIAVNHHQQVIDIYGETGTFWENYAPDEPNQGVPAQSEFVGWTGLTPITILLEYVFGIRAHAPENVIVWDVRLLDEHGVSRYPFGANGWVDLSVAARDSKHDEPQITVTSHQDLRLIVQWSGGEAHHEIKATG